MECCCGLKQVGELCLADCINRRRMSSLWGSGDAVNGVKKPTLTPDGAARLLQAWVRGHTARRLRRLLAIVGAHRDGPPWLVCSKSPRIWLLAATRQAEKDNSDDVVVSVDWGDGRCCSALSGLCTLSIDCNLCTVGCKMSPVRQPLALSVGLHHVAPGDVLHAKLSWKTGVRHLHCFVPLKPHQTLNLRGLVSPGGSAFGAPWAGPAPATAAPPPQPASRPERGFGIEMELSTLLPHGAAERQAALEQEARKLAAEHPEEAHLLARCALWVAASDVCIRHVPLAVAVLHLEQEAERDPSLLLAHSDMRERCLAMLCGEGPPGKAHKTEFKSPAPPHNLRFSAGAAEEVDCFIRLVRKLGSAACSVVSDGITNGETGTAIHVHINVLSSNAGGEPLSPREILNVFLGWVTYDVVLGRCARPWFWHDISAHPLWATGAEFCPKQFEPVGPADPAGHSPIAQNDFDPIRALRLGGSQPGCFDVVSFVAAVHSVLREPSFRAASRKVQLERLFGRRIGEYFDTSVFSPINLLGRFCSLNLHSVSRYGTVEVRRFHGSLDGPAIATWAHLCVSCVEAFRSTNFCEQVFDVELSDGLAMLSRSQESATVESLMEVLDGRVAREAVAWLINDSNPNQHRQVESGVWAF